MKEWLDNNKWNSFNSYKALLYRDWYLGIKEGKYLPPVEASIDPVNDCQLNCFWCNGKDVKDRHIKMKTADLFELCDFLIEWGVKGICFAGGGEPTLHESLGDIFGYLNSKNIPVSIITNGLFLDSRQLGEIAVNAQWIGISVDAASNETYYKIKGKRCFDIVVANIVLLNTYQSKEVTFKYLIHPMNQNEIYEAIKLATQLGCQGIHIRPVSFRNFQEKEDNFDIDKIEYQINKGFDDFGDRINIYAVRHKFDDNMHVKFPFKKCMATPLMPIFQANKTVTLCIDRKADDSLILCKYEHPREILKYWGSDQHKELVDKINLSECPKCTLTHCNEIYEKAIIENRMNWEFV